MSLFTCIRSLFSRKKEPPIAWQPAKPQPAPRPTQVDRPKNLDEALARLEQIITPQDKATIRFRGTGNLHHTFGRHIRNDWGLWDRTAPLHQWFVSKGIGHADDMSGIILRSLERRLRYQDIRLDEQIEYYRNFWLATGVDPVTQERIR